MTVYNKEKNYKAKHLDLHSLENPLHEI